VDEGQAITNKVNPATVVESPATYEGSG
jgi:hypothetical protein